VLKPHDVNPDLATAHTHQPMVWRDDGNGI